MAASDSRKYDVFLSFRGEDTRKNFVCHLKRALEQKLIETYIDSEKLEKGNNISELLNAIEESRLSIVVLSENYASSSWCLKELVKILECKDTNNQKVVPIFYQVDPSHIRKLNGKFGEAFAKHGENPNADKQELESWRSAVARVADLSGWDSSKFPDDIKLIEEIVEDTFKKWIHVARPSSLANDLVGMDSHILEVSLRLCRGVNDVGVVGIWGMGGIGKTTIARAVYGKIADQFRHKCFLGNVKEGFAKKGEAQMRGELLSEILEEQVQGVGILNEGSNMIMERLGTKKVLVVLDDVLNFPQIEALLGNLDSFGVGSRIIITTRDKQSLSGVDELYEPKHLSHDEAHELFMKYAFRKNQPTGDYIHLSNRAINYAQGLPLALKVLGASLYNKTEREWKGVLDKLKKTPHIGIMDVLKTSIEGLDDSEKDIFLDIACFFRGMRKDFVTEVLDSCGFFPDTGLSVLVDRALITLRRDELDMHDLLQEMGREIVRQESIKDQGERSRLWSYEDVDRVLTQSTATKAVECIVLDLSNSKFDLWIDTRAFVRMRKLRLLMICYSFYPITYDYDYRKIQDICPSDGCKQHVKGDFEFLSHELRFLLWHGCPLNSLPSKFNAKNLVRLDMRGSHIQQLWEGFMPLQKLKVILLNHCKCLVKIPDLTEATNLKRLVLDGCSSLIEVHPSISALQNLLILSLKGCEKLKILPSPIAMKSLETLDLCGCSNLDKFPEISDVMEKLTYLCLDKTAIKELPSSINNLTGLVTLGLEGCRELKILPSCICMECLETLDLFGCSNLDKFPEISDVMEKLTYLCLDKTAIKELPSSINNLTGLVTLKLKGCKELKILPSSICMKSLKTLDLYGCSNLKEFPEVSEVMKELAELTLSETAIKELPSSINNLTGLCSLYLKGCSALNSLSSIICLKSVWFLDLSGCQNLDKFPEIAEVMKELIYLYLDETAIKELPSSIERLQRLRSVSMRNCRSLVCLPDSICNLAHLTFLDLSGCSKLSSLPENIGSLNSLTELEVQDTGIKQLPFSLSCLRELKISLSRNGLHAMKIPFSAWWSSISLSQHTDHVRHLDLSDCKLLELSESIVHLSSLETLNLCRNNFESLPATMNRLGRLRDLRLEACDRLKSIPELSSSINYIDAHDCISLETVSKPEPQYHTEHFFTFSNCFQLVQTNLFRDIVERHSHFQDNCLRPLRLKMSLPGDEVPDWFDHRSRGFSVSVQLPPNWFDSKFLGFAICAVRTRWGTNYHTACLCTFKGNFGEYSFSFDLLDSVFRTDRSLRSYHMFLGYVPWSECPLIKEGRLVNETYTEAIFQIVVFSESITEQLCGVRLIYANPDEMLNLSMTRPQVHVNSCGTGVSFMDPCEMRNKETERAEITEVSREVESSEAGEGRDTCHKLQLFPEQQIERNGEKEIMEMTEQEEGEGCRMLRPVCGCLSLSGCNYCNMSLRKKETEREGDRMTGVSEDGELSELGSHSGLPVPEPQNERTEEEESMGFSVMEEESAVGRGLLRPLCRRAVQLLLLAGCTMALKVIKNRNRGL